MNFYEFVASADAEYVAVLEILGRSSHEIIGYSPWVWGIHQDEREDQMRNADWSDEGACDLVVLQAAASCFSCFSCFHVVTHCGIAHGI